jgi:hypothetical protein
MKTVGIIKKGTESGKKIFQKIKHNFEFSRLFKVLIAADSTAVRAHIAYRKRSFLLKIKNKNDEPNCDFLHYQPYSRISIIKMPALLNL